MCLHPGNTSEQLTAIPLENEVLKMLDGAKFIYCADAGLGSYNIRKFNSLGGRAFIVTQSIKKMSDVLKQAVFNDYGYRRLSDDLPVTVSEMKGFDRFDEKNLDLYNDSVYKVITADKAIDLGLYEESSRRTEKPDGSSPKGSSSRGSSSLSRKMMEYQRFIRSRRIERAKKLLSSGIRKRSKKAPMMSAVS